MSNMSRKAKIILPIILAIGVVMGISIGNYYARRYSQQRQGIVYGSNNKLNSLLHIISDQYVDTVNISDLIEDAMPMVLGELDPHSTYIPASMLESVNSELESSFSGIGVQFTIQNDTIHINSVIQGGPAEKVGLLAGDRIVKVNDSIFVGKIIDNDKVQSKLKGPKGSEVKVSVKRFGEKDLLDFVITRGDVPQNSIDAAYMIDGEYGYVQITKFARGTHLELLSALAKFSHENFKGLIIDLRDNTGGYMDAAVRMVNEFLPKDRLIVFAEGRSYPRIDEYANGTGSFQQLPLVVLINEASASASEIFAGAIQDNDRGTIVGRRSFGKGLVQQPLEFSDGSAIRLTVARYYTPSGRSIQRPYENGNDAKYEQDWLERYENGEYFSADSIKLNQEDRHTTLLGREVFGHGGIMPDVFVPQDTTGVTSYLIQVNNQGIISRFAFEYCDKNRQKLQDIKDNAAFIEFLKKQDIVGRFISYAEQKGIKRRNILISKSMDLLEKYVVGGIIYNMMGMSSYTEYLNETDDTVQKALEILRNGESFPKAPESAQQ